MDSDSSCCGENTDSRFCPCTRRQLSYQQFIGSVGSIGLWVIQRYQRHPRLMRSLFGKKPLCWATAIYNVGIHVVVRSIEPSTTEKRVDRNLNQPQPESLVDTLMRYRRCDPLALIGLLVTCTPYVVLHMIRQLRNRISGRD